MGTMMFVFGFEGSLSEWFIYGYISFTWCSNDVLSQPMEFYFADERGAIYMSLLAVITRITMETYVP